MTRPRVIVGIDGQEPGEAQPAMAAAVRAAGQLGADVQVVHGLGAHVGTRRPVADTEVELQRVENLLHSIRERLLELVPDETRVSTMVSSLTGPEVLVAVSAGADLVVLQRRSRGPLSRLVLGSTTSAVAARSHCPVMIIHGTDEDVVEGSVLVAVDSRGHSAGAVREAFVQADRCGSTLTVLNAYQPQIYPAYGYVPPDPYEVRVHHDDARATASGAVAGYAEEFPGVDVRVELVQGSIPDALIAASKDHSLLVLARHTNRHHGTSNLGQVVRRVIEGAACPVLVVPSSRPLRARSSNELGEHLVTQR